MTTRSAVTWLHLGMFVLMLLVGCSTDTSGSTTPGGSKRLGEPCSQTEDCASSLCVRVEDGGGVCSAPCDDERGCPRADNWGCAPTTEGFSVCACVRLAEREVCGDGLDNDCNGAIDDCRYCDGRRVADDDPAHCGGCNDACRADQACVAGRCSCEDSRRTECAGRCVALDDDVDNCGECGNRCSRGQACVAGTCACPSGQTSCDGEGCFDLDTDTDHCGTCDGVCTDGRACRGGDCVCADVAKPHFCPGLGCLDLQSDPKHCGECDEACAAGESCVLGSCKCSEGRTACEDGCKNTQTDPENCGECGNACPAALACIGGECGCTGTGYAVCGERCAALETDEKNCGGCGRACAAGETCESGECRCESGLTCAGACVRDNDDANCGACGNACPAGQRCAGSACVCEGAGLSQCGADCLNLANDEHSCGECDKACQNGESCVWGACQCPAGSTYCSGADDCVSLNEDEKNCGACGKECSPTEECRNAQCTCPQAGQLFCEALGACVDVSSSVAHCGGCTTTCNAGEICQNGVCGCPSYTEQYCASQKACTDVYTSDQHCGTCDHACPAGTHCSFGNCACEGGQSLCGDSKCYDLATDAAHCGSCDKACGASQVCDAGLCRCVSPTIGAEKRLTTTLTQQSDLAAVWSGTNVALAYLRGIAGSGSYNLRFALLTADGAVVSDNALTSFDASSGDTVPYTPSLTWNGAEFGLAYFRQTGGATTRVLLQRLNANGTSKGAPVVVSEPPANQYVMGPVGLGWSPSYGGYAVSYYTPSGMVFRRIGATGATLSAENLVPSSESGRIAQVSTAPDGSWGVNSGGLTWFNADGSKTLPSLDLSSDVSLLHDGASWLATFGLTDGLWVQRGTANNRALLWPPKLGTVSSAHASTLVAGNLGVLAAQGQGLASLHFQRFTLPSPGTSVALTPIGPPVPVLTTETNRVPFNGRNLALVATGARALLAIWADSRWGVNNDLYAARLDLPACP